MDILRKLSRPAAAALGVVALSLLGSTAAQAQVVPLGLEELVAVSDEIATVRVVETESRFHGRIIVTTATFEVLESFKGKMTGTQETTYMGGSAHGVVMAVPQAVQLAPGEEMILFLSRPFDRMPKSMQDRFNFDSPLVSSFQVVGGFQGRFDLISSANGEPNKTRRGAEPLPAATISVTRGIGMAQQKGLGELPTYEAFRQSLGELIAAEEQTKSTKGATSEITGIIGKFAIPPRTSDPLVRMFDPLPAFAYLSPDELEELQKRVWDEQKSQMQNQPQRSGLLIDVTDPTSESN